MLRKNFLNLLFISVLVLIPGFIFGAGQSEHSETGKGGQVEVSINQFQVELTQILPELAQEYSAANSKVNVTVERAGGDNYWQVLKSLVASNELHDVYGLFGWSFVEEYASAGLTLDLTGQPVLNNITPAFLDAVTYDGHIHAIPFTFQSMGVLYNREIFDRLGLEIPETISEMKIVVDTLNKNKIQPFVVAYKDAWTLRQLFSIGHTPTVEIQKFVAGMNTGVETSFYSPAMDSVFDMFDLMDENSQEKPFDTDFMTASTKFAMGEAAMFIQGDWVVGIINEINPAMQHGIFPMPINEIPGDAKLSVDVGQTFAINSKSELQHEALAFLDWLSQPTQANRIKDAVAFMLPFKGVDPPQSLGQTGNDIINYIATEQTCPWGYIIWPAGFDVEVQQAMQEYFINHNRKEFFDSIDRAYQNYR